MKNKELFDELQENEAMLKAKEEEKILKREEVLRERRLNGHRRHKNGAHPVNPYGGNSFNDADTTQDKYETRDGKKVIREYSGYGL